MARSASSHRSSRHADPHATPQRHGRRRVGDAPQRLEASVRHERDVGVGCAAQQRPGAGGADRRQRSQPREARRARRILRRESLDRSSPTLRCDHHALREDHRAVPGAQSASERLDRVDLPADVVRGAIEEVVGDSVPDDVETRVDEQIVLEHEARSHSRLGQQPRGQQAVDDAHVLREQHQRTAPEPVEPVDLDAQVGEDGERIDEAVGPPALQRVVGGRIVTAPGERQTRCRGDPDRLQRGPCPREPEPARDREPPTGSNEIHDRGRRRPQGGRAGQQRRAGCDRRDRQRPPGDRAGEHRAQR
jgi:hypothetical protein